jgi:6-phosphogluconolactonase
MPHTPRTIAYVSCAADKQIVRLAFDPLTGALRELDRVDVPGGEGASGESLPLALSPDRSRLYAGLRATPYPVASYAIDPRDGALRILGTGRLADSMCYLSTDATGRALFSASYSGGLIAVNPIDAGGVAGDPVQVIPTPPKAHSILPDPANRFVHVASLGGEAVLCQAFDAATLRLAPAVRRVSSAQPGAGPRHIAFGRGGAMLYVVNELDATIDVFARDAATGSLTHRQTTALLPAGAEARRAAADIHLTPDERFLYASERTTHVLAGFAVDPAEGTLSAVCRIPSEATPRGFAIAPGGRFLLCAGLTSGRVGVFAIDAERGVLTQTASLPVGDRPNWIEFVSLGPA